MKICWDERHGSILMDFLNQLNEKNIRYFIIRGFEGLPNRNASKDVDIMIDPKLWKKAETILKHIYAAYEITYLDNNTFGHIHCYNGICPEKEFSIHIDLVAGYISKGYEIFTFEELYKHVVKYNKLNVLDEPMNGLMILVYKIFGYRNAALKLSYQKCILQAYLSHSEEFKKILTQISGEKLGSCFIEFIRHEDYESIIRAQKKFTRKLKRYAFQKHPFHTINYVLQFWFQKIYRIILCYRKFARVFAVIAPDGTGKTTFLTTLIDKMNFYYVNEERDQRFHMYHFRPNLLPNLGEVGQRAGVMKQDIDFTNPHRSKPAGIVSSLFRISYYTADYIIGWQKCVRHDVHYDKYTVFDRYAYDFVVDPLRTKLGLPLWLRKVFVFFVPRPPIVFVLMAKTETVYTRKQELTKDEISRQLREYERLAQSDKRFKIIDAEQAPEEMAEEAVQILLSRYTKKINETEKFNARG